jgi:hypothetical protein
MGQLVWIASYPKSGSTWLRAFLHNYIREPQEPYDINSLMDLSTGESGATLYRRHDPRPASQYAIADVQRMRPLVHHELAASHPNLVFVKTHNASLLVEGVPLMTPDVTAGAIYILRDPRDVAISYSHHLGRSIDDTISLMADPEAATGGTDVKVYERLSSWSVHVHFWTRKQSSQLHVMRYEDMVDLPEATFAGLLRFLGHEPPPERLAVAIRFSNFNALSEQERAKGFIERPATSTAPFFRSGKPGQWRTILTPSQRARIERDHGALMGRFGYL